MKTLLALAADLASGRTSSAELVDAALAAIDSPDGEGSRAFVFVDHARARQDAERADQARRCGQAPSAYCGIPISLKDLFDVAGQVTRAGSRLLADQPAATADATVVRRLRDAGFVFVGRTNMTEFAYSGLGLNPHYGTPLNPYDRAGERIPGGSSSGAAVSVTDGMAAAAIGTDTGGSCRIPAAFCGLVGYKPTAARIPRDGVLPLSESLDSVGSLARSVGCCAILDRIMSGNPAPALATSLRPMASIRLGIPRHLVLNDLCPAVAKAFERARQLLGRHGATVVDVDFEALEDLPTINRKGGIAAAEAFAWHRRYLATNGHRYDPRVRTRILKGGEQTAADYLDVLRARRVLMRQARAVMTDLDGLAYPTVPTIAPPLASVGIGRDDDYATANALALRNPSVANFLDACAISLPIHRADEPPVGMNIIGHAGGDEKLFTVAAALEQALQRSLARH